MTDVFETVGPLLRPLTPQAVQADIRQVKNRAGGYVFKADPFEVARRFLIMGAFNTFYAQKDEIAQDMASAFMAALDADGLRTAQLVHEISTKRANVRQHPVIWAWAVCSASKDPAVRSFVADHFTDVVRTGTQLFLFTKYAKGFRGAGRGLRRAVGSWYHQPGVEYQLVKYRQREGWTHRDVLRRFHPTSTPALRWAAGKAAEGEELGQLIEAFDALQRTEHVPTAEFLVRQHSLPWEAIPDRFLNERSVLEAAMLRMPGMALVRQLPRLQKAGISVSDLAAAILTKAGNQHPVFLLNAELTYASGQGRGQSWKVEPKILDALDATVEAAFEGGDRFQAKTAVVIDVSGSMGSGFGRRGHIPHGVFNAYTSTWAPLVYASVLAAGFVKLGDHVDVLAVDTRLHHPAISSRQRFDDVVRTVAGYGGGGTNLGLAIQALTAAKDSYELIVMLSDNETWAGGGHVHQHLARYRHRHGLARFVGVDLVPNSWSLTPNDDPLSLQAVGWDPAIFDATIQFAG